MTNSSSLLKFKRPNVVPPGGQYFFVDPDTDEFFSAPHLADLVRQENIYRKVNDLPPIDNLAVVIEDYICRHSPTSFCRGWIPEEEKDRAAKMFTVDQVMEGTRMLTQIWKKGARATCVSREAEDRAAICAKCPENIPVPTCISCVLPSIFIRQRTKNHRVLHVCNLCRCSLKAKVWVTKEILSTAVRRPYPEHCWMRPILGGQHGQEIPSA